MNNSSSSYMKMMIVSIVFLFTLTSFGVNTNTPTAIPPEILDQTKTFQVNPSYKIYSGEHIQSPVLTLKQDRKVVDKMTIADHEFTITEGYVPFSTNPLDTGNNQKLREISARQVELGHDTFWSMERGVGVHLSHKVDLTVKGKGAGACFEINIPFGKKK